MEEKRKKPKYNPLKNSCYLAGRAWREVPLILPLAAGMVLAGIAANLLELLAAPAVLRSVERGDSPAALVRLVLVFTLAMILVYGGRAYLDTNTIFSRVHLRLKLSSDVHSKFCRTAYPHLLDTDFLQEADRAMAPTNGNMDAGEAVWDTLTDLTVHSVSFAVYLLLLAGLEPVLLAVTVISAGASYWAGLGLRRWRYRHRKEEEQIGHKVLYIHRSAAKRTLAKDIRIFGLRDWLMELWTENLTLLRDFRAKAERMELLADCLDILATLLRNGAAYYYLLRLAVGGGLSAAEFVLYFSAATGLGAWTGSILQDINTLNRQSGELSILREFLEKPEPFRFDKGEPLTPQPGHIYTLELRDVSFRYPGGEKDVLHQVNLTIRPGERLAIVGLNGAGKTTMIRLLCGFLDPTEGQVLLDGVDIRRYDRRDYYRLIGAVFQQSSILAGTIGENVAQCPGDYDRQRAEQCLAWADLIVVFELEFVEFLDGKILVVRHAVAETGNAYVRGLGIGVGELYEGFARHFSLFEFEAGGVADFAAGRHGGPLFAHNDGVAVVEADGGNLTAQNEGVEIRRSQRLLIPEYADVAIAAPAGIYASGLVEEGENIIGGRTLITAGMIDETRDEHGDVLSVQRAHIDLNIGDAGHVQLADDGLLDLGGIAAGKAEQRNAAYFRQVQ